MRAKETQASFRRLICVRCEFVVTDRTSIRTQQCETHTLKRSQEYRSSERWRECVRVAVSHSHAREMVFARYACMCAAHTTHSEKKATERVE